jgi:hypothetical protein
MSKPSDSMSGKKPPGPSQLILLGLVRGPACCPGDVFGAGIPEPLPEVSGVTIGTNRQ